MHKPPLRKFTEIQQLPNESTYRVLMFTNITQYNENIHCKNAEI